MAAAAGFICELAACLPPLQALRHLLPLALAVLGNRSYPQPVLELLSNGVQPLRRAAAALDPGAAQPLERGVRAACQRLQEGRWPTQSRLYTLGPLGQRLAAVAQPPAP
jgi:hypothetical protein